MQEMTLGLHLAGAPHVLRIDRDAGKRVGSMQDLVTRMIAPVLEREGVERGGEFVRDEQQRRRQAGRQSRMRLAQAVRSA